MTTDAQLVTLLEELIDILHDQAKEVERLTAHVEGATTPLPEASQMPLVISRLSALRQQLRALRAQCAGE
ncbi:MAG TPA: hypothetical protein ENJ50_09580 [Planctomycetaceae bacterium]|nr:hypothetical protein [Planctomycetaceae bacterium]